jgi:hypothetical protein
MPVVLYTNLSASFASELGRLTGQKLRAWHLATMPFLIIIQEGIHADPNIKGIL